ncbi:MAG: universal stress protein [Clostridia bacterium]|nr:universal stress protein [Clostridia bacterium]
MKKILLPSDGSPYSLKAARYARSLLEKLPGTTLTILHVGDVPKELLSHGYLMEVTLDPELIKQLVEDKTEKVINETKAIFAESNVGVDTLIQLGNPVDVICRLVEEKGYDLVIIGSRGLSEIKGLLLGSISDRVSHLAKCPVLIVK